MAKKEKDRARYLRAFFMDLLGNRCAICGITKEECARRRSRWKRYLQFDCIEPCGDKHHKMDTSMRMTFYRRQLRADNLQILCCDCNAAKSRKEREKNPF